MNILKYVNNVIILYFTMVSIRHNALEREIDTACLYYRQLYASR